MKKKDKSIAEELEELRHIERKYKALLNAIPSIAWFTDEKSNYIDVNEAFIIHCGKETEDIIGKGHKYVWDGKIGDECLRNDEKVLTKKEIEVFQEIVPGRRGNRTFNVYRNPVIDENGNPIGIVAVAKDITSLKNRDTQIKTIIENIPFKIWLRDKNGNYINSNCEFAQSRKTTVEQLIGRNINEFYNKEELEEIFKEDKSIIENRKTIKFLKRITNRGDYRAVEVYKTPVFDIGNELIGIVGIIIDVTKSEQTKQLIKKQAYTDSQTGLLNRRALYEYVKNRFRGNQITIMIIDVDNFKHINDTYSHIIGDRVLYRVSNVLKQICKKDFLFRFGGDEFIVISNYPMDKQEIKDKSNYVLQQISSIKFDEMINEKVNISVGVATCNCCSKSKCKTYDKCNKEKCTEKCKEGECKLISKADIALFKAKEHGKNRAVIYTKGLDDEINKIINIENKLSNAIENKEIELHYQPQYTIDGNLAGFEALLRWNNKEYSNIPIIEIITIMEKSDLIIKIGKEIMKQACLFSKKINKNRKDKIVVYINVSPKQIMDTNFIDNVREVIEEVKIHSSEEAKGIGIEITETMIFNNIDESVKKIKMLKDFGVNISLDDFGTGSSSLSYLLQLPLTTAKIDRSFIVGMEKSEGYEKLVKLIIEGSHYLGFKVVAEGVENEKQLNMLKQMDVDYIQGYICSKPLKEEDALELLERESRG